MTKAHTPAALAAALLVLTACSGPDAASPTEDAAPGTGRNAGPHYVALGDSYTAAPLVTADSADDPCVRSSLNYPRLIARSLGARLVDRSCTGADILNLTEGQLLRTGQAGPQVSAVTPDTDLVTVGIGGNPAAAQAWFDICPALREEDPTGAPCRKHLRAVGDGEDALGRLLRVERKQLRALLAVLHRRAPDARVLLVGYPAIFPAQGSCPDRLTLADGDVGYARSTLHRLNRMLEQTAKEHGAEYVDVYAATRGHDICAEDPWIQGRNDQVGVALAYHPRAAEQRAVAELLLHRLT